MVPSWCIISSDLMPMQPLDLRSSNLIGVTSQEIRCEVATSMIFVIPQYDLVVINRL